MDQQELFKPVPLHKLASLDKEELLEFVNAQQRVIDSFEKQIVHLRALNDELKQKHLFVDEQYITLKNKFFGKSSERESSEENRNKAGGKSRKKKKKVQLPSLRYPNAPLIEREVEFETPPECGICGGSTTDSGMTEDAEYLTIIPAQFIIIRQKRHKYTCDICHSTVITAPAPPRIKPGSGYSDEMIIDVAMSKYCDLIPIERYAAIAGREGLKDLPPNSLIEQTHHLADFVEGAYDKVGEEILSDKVLQADETPHRMLEGDEKDSWFLWGFSTQKSSYFECHDTRSGDVCSELLNKAEACFLVSDVFSGYAKAVREANKFRKESNLPPILNVYCNAHYPESHIIWS